MRLLDRYITRQFTATFLALVVGLPLLFIVADVTDNLDDYLSRGISRQAVALSYVYYLPQFIFWSIPIAGLVATVFTISNMTRHQEITAAKAGGVSFYRLLAPILILSALLSVAAVGVGELVPVAMVKRLQVLGERSYDLSTLRTNFVFQAEDGRTLAVRRLDSAADVMHEVVIERNPTEETPGVHLVARRATWADTTGWTIRSGYLRLIPRAGGENTFQFDSLRIRTLEETPEEMLAEPKEPEEMRYAEMQRFIRTMRSSGADVRKLEVELAQKVSLPLALFVIVLFGAPLSTSSKRGGTAYGVGVSLGVTIVYLLLFKVGTAVGSSGAMDPLVAAWFPNALFLAGGIVLLWRVRT